MFICTLYLSISIILQYIYIKQDAWVLTHSHSHAKQIESVSVGKDKIGTTETRTCHQPTNTNKSQANTPTN